MQRIVCFNEADDRRPLRLSLGSDATSIVRWYPETGARSEIALCPAGNILCLQCAPQEVLCLELRRETSSRDNFLADSFFLPMPSLVEPVILGSGWLLQTGASPVVARPISVTEGWEKQGLETYSGAGTYRTGLQALPRLEGAMAWHLIFPEVAGTLECSIDGSPIGSSAVGHAAFDLSGFEGGGQIEVVVRNSAANRLYAGTPYWDEGSYASGLLQPSRIEPWAWQPGLTYAQEQHADA